jgi:signal transduction histidine kinase
VGSSLASLPMEGVAELWRRPFRWLREHPLAADTIVAVALTALAIVVHVTVDESDQTGPVREPSWWTLLLVVASSMPIMFRRVRPTATLLVLVFFQVLIDIYNVFAASWVAVIVAVYSVGAHTDGRRRLAAVITAGVPVGVFLTIGVVEDEMTLVDAIATLGMFTAAFVIGDNVRRRRLHVESLAERAETAERERDLLARERVTEERARIARELHDIVAHSVSVMVIQAAAARRNLVLRPEEATALLENIESTGRQTMDELRQVLGVLRDADSERVAMPLPTLADLEALVDTHGGLPARLAVTGIIDHVPAGIGLSAYRVVQEALTNANRHAGPGATIDVRVTCDDQQLEVRVDDDGRGASTSRSAEGYGLIGMKERVGAAGGTFSAGPRAGGGWRVSARFPMPAAGAVKLVS